MKTTRTLFAVALFCGNMCLAQSWQVFDESNSDIPQNHVTALSFDQDGLLWVGTKARGLATFDETTWATFDTSALSVSCMPNITDISINPVNNDVWVTAHNICGVLQFERASASWISHGFLFNTGLRCVEIDSEGIVWIGNEANGGLFRYDGTSFLSFNEGNSDNPNDYVYCVGVLNDDERWVGGTHAIGLMNDNTGWVSYPPDSFWGRTSYIIASDVEIENDSISWFAHRTGILKFNKNQDEWTSYTDVDYPALGKLCDTYLRSIAIDGAGNKWITSCEGLVKFDNTNWTVYPVNNTNIGFRYLTVVEVAPDQKVWVGTRTGGLAVFTQELSTGVDQTIGEEGPVLSLFPNPANNQFQLSISNKDTYSLKVFDANGRVALGQNQVKNGDVIKASGLVPGTYYVVLEKEGSMVTQKILIK